MEDPPPVLESTPELFYEINVIQTMVQCMFGDTMYEYIVLNDTSESIDMMTNKCMKINNK